MAAEDVIQEVKSRLEALIAPVDGGVGADISYDQAFETLKGELDKLQAVAGGKVDWGAVAVGADELLTEKSKDFRVALYYAAAKAHTDGLPGLLDGFVLVQELIGAYWEPMYPSLRRPKARGNLVSWFGDLATAKFQQYQPGASEVDLVKALEKVSTEVDRTLRDKLEDNYPGMLNLQNLVRSLVASLPREAPPPPPPPDPSTVAAAAASPPASVAAPSIAAPAAPSGVSVAVPSASMNNADEALDVIGDCGKTIITAADVVRTADPGNPLAYRYLRTGAWMRLVQTPPNDSGVTIVPAPPEGIKSNLDGMMQSDNFLGVIQAAEEAAATYILWLDPHRYIANAMDRMGAIFINAKKALVLEIAILLSRVPTLPNLKFDDGTPFADGQTKMWIEAEVASAFGAAGKSAGGGNGAGSTLDGPIGEARTLAAQGKLPEAIELVANAAAAAPSGADRFRGRLAVAKLCLQAGQFAIARAQLEGLVWLTEQHKLAEWDPSLCAELYSALYAAHRGINTGDEVPADARAREAAAFERLCQLDAGAALKLSEG